MITYGDLYLFLEQKLSQRKQRNKNIKAFYFTKKFCQINNINYSSTSRIIQVLSDFGASNDIEVLWNVAESIADETPIDSDIETPIEFAIKNGYYTKWHEGMWVRCKQNDIGAMPDLNTAYQILYERRSKK